MLQVTRILGERCSTRRAAQQDHGWCAARLRGRGTLIAETHSEEMGAQCRRKRRCCNGVQLIALRTRNSLTAVFRARMPRWFVYRTELPGSVRFNRFRRELAKSGGIRSDGELPGASRAPAKGMPWGLNGACWRCAAFQTVSTRDRGGPLREVTPDPPCSFLGVPQVEIPPSDAHAEWAGSDVAAFG